MRRREVHGRPGADGLVEQPSPLAERAIAEVRVAEGEQIEGEHVGRRLRGQPVHPRGGGVDALLEGVEVEPGGPARPARVDDAALGRAAPARWQLGEVARQGPLVAAAQLHLVAVAEHDAAEAVPLGLVEPAVASGRRRPPWPASGDRRHHGQAHPAVSPSGTGRPDRPSGQTTRGQREQWMIRWPCGGVPSASGYGSARHRPWRRRARRPCRGRSRSTPWSVKGGPTSHVSLGVR